jgi:hypothetical protein
MTPSDSPPIEALLRECLATPEVPDNGFTERVVGSLSRRRRPGLAHHLQLALVWGCSGAGLTLSLWLVGSSDWASQEYPRLGESMATLFGNPWWGFAFAAVYISYMTALVTARAACRS